jgi:hypothetical protein
MELALTILGVLLAGGAVLLAFITAGAVREAGRGEAGLPLAVLKQAERKIWISAGCATGAGMIQASSGDYLIATVWILFLAVQAFNLNTVLTAKRRPVQGRD